MPVPVLVLKDLVWLEFEDPPQRTAAGLWLPQSFDQGDDGKRPPVTARVVALGPGRRLPGGSVVPPNVSLGQRVLIGAYEGSRIEWRGRYFIIVYEIAIHAIVEDDKLS